MFPRASLLALTLAAVASAQQIGTNTAESHLPITASTCTTSGGCVSASHSLVLDANWRWLHSTSGYTNCYSGNAWDTTLCPDATTCAKNCALDGADYSGTYGVTTSGNSAKLDFVTQNANGQNVGSRLYLMDKSDSGYQGFNLINQEFTLDIDMSKLGCGLNGAVYFSEMALDGGMSTQPNNKAGAKYGTGYCDSQCPRDLKFIGGLANAAGWNATTANSGKGQFGSCCSEMDIWEANQFAEAVTPHPCSSIGLARTDCTANGGAACANGGVCDAAGCDFNSWRMGNQTFLGPGSGFTIDTTKPITAVTQFISSDGTSNGDLIEIRRKFVQNGIMFDNSFSNIPGLTPYNSITDATCAAQKTAFQDGNTFAQEGGLKAMGAAFKRGMVLVLSIWDDTAVSMQWLDSDYPPTASASAPGVNRGPCATTAGTPADVEKNQASDSVIYSNIRWGDIGSTTGSVTTAPGGGGGTTTKTGTTTTIKSTTTSSISSTSTPKPSGCTASKYGQCGGQGWTGCTTCASGSTCKSSNQYYSQCL